MRVADLKEEEGGQGLSWISSATSHAAAWARSFVRAEVRQLVRHIGIARIARARMNISAEIAECKKI